MTRKTKSNRSVKTAILFCVAVLLVTALLPTLLSLVDISGSASTNTAPKNQTKTVTPTRESQTVVPDKGFDGLDSVEVSAVTKDIDANIKPEYIKQGAEILGVKGTYKGEKIPLNIAYGKTLAPPEDTHSLWIRDNANPTKIVVSPYTQSNAVGETTYQTNTEGSNNLYWEHNGYRYAFSGGVLTSTCISTGERNDNSLGTGSAAFTPAAEKAYFVTYFWSRSYNPNFGGSWDETYRFNLYELDGLNVILRKNLSQSCSSPTVCYDEVSERVYFGDGQGNPIYYYTPTSFGTAISSSKGNGKLFAYNNVLFDINGTTVSRIESDGTLTTVARLPQSIGYCYVDGHVLYCITGQNLFSFDIESLQTTDIASNLPTFCNGASVGEWRLTKDDDSVRAVCAYYETVTPFSTILQENVLQILTKSSSTLPLEICVSEDIAVSIYPQRVQIGQSNNTARVLEAFLFDGSKWVDISSGIPYGFDVSLSLQNISSSTGISTRVEYDGTTEITLTAKAGYNLPDNVTVSGATASWDKSTGKLTLSNPTGNVTVTAAGIAIDYSVTAFVENCTASDSNPTIVHYGDTKTFVFTADTYYVLPSSISVSGATLDSWTQSTGTAVIRNVTGNVTITVTATKITYTLAENLTNIDKSGTHPTSIAADETLTLVYATSDGYDLPDSVTVSGATASWDKSTGKLTLSNPTGNVTITAAGEVKINENAVDYSLKFYDDKVTKLVGEEETDLTSDEMSALGIVKGMAWWDLTDFAFETSANTAIVFASKSPVWFNGTNNRIKVAGSVQDVITVTDQTYSVFAVHNAMVTVVDGTGAEHALQYSKQYENCLQDGWECWRCTTHKDGDKFTEYYNKQFAATDANSIVKSAWNHSDRQHVAAVAPTCTSGGNAEYYLCNKCHKYLKAVGENAWEEFDPFLPATGHTLVDGVCTVCGFTQPTSECSIAVTLASDGNCNISIYEIDDASDTSGGNFLEQISSGTGGTKTVTTSKKYIRIETSYAVCWEYSDLSGLTYISGEGSCTYFIFEITGNGSVWIRAED